MVPCYLQGTYSDVSFFDESSAAEFGFEKFARSSERRLSYVFLHRLFDCVRFQFLQVLVVFLLF